MIRIKLRTLLWFTFFVAVALGWIVRQREIAERQEQAILWLNQNSTTGRGEGRAPALYVYEYHYSSSTTGARHPFLRDYFDSYLQPVFGRRYLGADRLQIICDEGFAFNREQIERFVDLVDLKRISLFAYTLTNDQLIQMTRLPSIENLLLSGAFLITDESAVHIADMPELYELELSGSEITDKTLIALCRCRNLKEIMLDGNDNITYEGARQLRDCLRPVRFDVSRCARISVEQQQELGCHGPSRY